MSATLVRPVQALAAIPGITGEQAQSLVQHGITRLEDLLEAEAADLAPFPDLAPYAGAILEAARAEAVKRTISIGDTPVSG